MDRHALRRAFRDAVHAYRRLRRIAARRDADRNRESRRLPGSGAGPSPDRMFIGSEGILGVISQAWMRLQAKPTFRAGGRVKFKTFFSRSAAVRAISQAGLCPSNCRILNPREACFTGAADVLVSIMVLA